MKTKVVVLLSGAMIALLLLARYFALSRAGLPVGWMLYLGLPVTVGGVLFALRLASLGSGWGPKINNSQHYSGMGTHAHTLQTYPAPPASVSERLAELENLRSSGAISETEYAARRLEIIASI
jgi:hypothetical protein